MANARSIRLLHSPTPAELGPTRGQWSQSGSFVPSRRADFPPGYNGYTGNGAPYDAGSTGRRLSSFSPTRLGPSTSLWSTHDLMVARCHDEVRNNPWAASAVDNFESQNIGSGIRPKWNIKDESLKLAIEREFHLACSSTAFDYNGLCDWYGLQALAAREIFEAGEVFCRRHIRPIGWKPNPNINRKMRVPVQFQLIESEQVPIWLNISATTPGPVASSGENVVRTGKEFDKYGRLVAFHMFREHPGETMFFTSSALAFARVTSDNIIHCYKPFRAGLLRGQPHLASVLLLLHELTKYTDATVVAKQIQSMFAGFIRKITPESEIIPPDVNLPPVTSPIGTRVAHIEPGSLNELYPGEDITFPNLPQNSDMESFISVMLHQFASGIGATYEQITGDLRGVNLSSIRAGVQDAHRKSRQFVRNVMIAQFCAPIVNWWMDEAVLSGRLRLPGYAEEPEQYQDITWNTSGWPWLDPVKDVEAKQTAVRCGFTSREAVCAETGEDIEKIDAQQERDNAAADKRGLVYDSDPRKVLIGRESNPQVKEEGEPEDQTSEKTKTGTGTGTGKPVSGNNRSLVMLKK